jgi:hypothetical protein
LKDVLLLLVIGFLIIGVLEERVVAGFSSIVVWSGGAKYRFFRGRLL